MSRQRPDFANRSRIFPISTCEIPRVPWCRCVRWRSPASCKGPQLLVRYNGFRAAIINGAPKPGFSSGQALNAMERISATLPAGYSYEWTATALQERAAGGGPVVLGLALLFAYLFLVGLYESWNIPISALLSVSVDVLGAIAAVVLSGRSFDVYSEDRPRRARRARRQERHPHRRLRGGPAARGQSILESAVAGARLRFRPVMMTSFAFILGLLAARDRGRRRARPAGAPSARRSSAACSRPRSSASSSCRCSTWSSNGCARKQRAQRPACRRALRMS